MTNNNILDNYVCVVPFIYMEIHSKHVYGCCPSWMPQPYGTTDKLDEVWNGEIATKTRESVLDGSYSYCDKNKCPHLSQLINLNYPTENFIQKSNFKDKYNGPNRLNLCFDRSCNLSCPSCRNEFIIAKDEEIESIDNIMNSISKTFKNTASMIYISGSSEPFASKTFKKFLKNVNLELFPNIHNIHIHTNGLLLDEKMWNQIENSHKYIKTIEVSIDAATKETYEKIRRGGNWEKLIENLKFISSIPTIGGKWYSFVVQDTNYKEMKMFYDLISDLPHSNRNYNIYFGKIANWGTYTDEEYLVKQIWNEKHENFQDFLKELAKVAIKFRSTNNMNDIIDKYKLNKPTSLI